MTHAYANGEGTDKERLAALRTLRPLCQVVDIMRPIAGPADCALEAACYTPGKVAGTLHRMDAGWGG